jgi:hypothetical protein
MGPLATPVMWCRASVKAARRSPVSGDAGPGRRHRHLGMASGNERGKDHTDGSSAPIVDVAREQEPVSAADALRSGRDARVGWLEAETEGTLLAELAGEGDEVFGVGVGGDPSHQVPSGPRGHGRRYHESSCFEIERRIHASVVYVDVRP